MRLKHVAAFAIGITALYPKISPGQTTPMEFKTVTPCRIVDTRTPSGAPEMAAGTTRSFLPSTNCFVPTTALAYSVNVTVVPDSKLGYLTMWPTGEPQPLVSTLNSDGRVKANAAIVPAGTDGKISVYVTDSTHVIIDINGYFVLDNTQGSGLQFYQVAPCRVVDTRKPTGPLGGPYIVGGAPGRPFNPLTSNCNLPSTATAYSMNFTAVPHGPLGYLTVWPTDQTQPVVSTLNASTGTVTANAAIVPAAANGSISVYASNDTDLVIDVNGYFAPPNAGGLDLYTLAPCRVLDTRDNNGAPFNGTIAVTLITRIGSGCLQRPRTSPQAYVLNATVVPPGPLTYLTLWPDGEAQPFVSTLNSFDGAITSNMAIVPTDNTMIDAYASNPTHLVLDLSGFFAPYVTQ
jgi:hypothetical protein